MFVINIYGILKSYLNRIIKLAKEKQKKPNYDNKYYKKKYIKYRSWEKDIGRNIVSMFQPKSILDLGCGIGSYLEGALEGGCKDLYGIELNYDKAKKYITKNISFYIKSGDITKELNLKKKFDCVLSIEVAEHVEMSQVSFFINNIIRYAEKYILFTAAPPGQPGRGHINLKKKNFWIKYIEDKGVTYKDEIVQQCVKAWSDFNTPLYILQNLMVFESL